MINACVETVGLSTSSGMMLASLRDMIPNDKVIIDKLGKSTTTIIGYDYSKVNLSLVNDFLAYYGMISGLVQVAEALSLLIEKKECFPNILILTGLSTMAVSAIYEFWRNTLPFLPIFFLFLALTLNAVIKTIKHVKIDGGEENFPVSKIMESLSFFITSCFLSFSSCDKKESELVPNVLTACGALASLWNVKKRIDFGREKLATLPPHP